MKVMRGIKRVVKPFVDVPSWMGAREVGDYGRSIFSAVKGLFSTPPPPESNEDFSVAIARLRLSEADLQRRAQQFAVLAYLFLVIGLGVLAYSISLLLDGSFRGAVVGLAVTVFVLSLAFRNHFWLFQIKHRRLGCTFRDWLNGTVRGSSK